jgi:hypothetical protein
VSVPAASSLLSIGFLTALQEPSGWVGGYLVTNSWGRPLEFRLTTAVQPNRVQAALYGPTLTEYILADLIGKALVEKTAAKPDLIVTDVPAVLALRSRVEVPVLAVKTESAVAPPDAVPFSHARSTLGLLLPGKFAADQGPVLKQLERVDAAVDLAEPFTRVREAMAEARKMGVTNRAA